MEQDPENIKENYLKKYNVKQDAKWVIRQEKITDKEKGGEINVEDIPF